MRRKATLELVKVAQRQVEVMDRGVRIERPDGEVSRRHGRRILEDDAGEARSQAVRHSVERHGVERMTRVRQGVEDVEEAESSKRQQWRRTVSRMTRIF